MSASKKSTGMYEPTPERMSKKRYEEIRQASDAKLTAYVLWEERESRLGIWKALIAAALIAGVLAAALIGYLNRSLGDYRTYLYAGVAFCISLLFVLIFRLALGGSEKKCRRAFTAYYDAERTLKECRDELKREKLEYLLENQLLIYADSSLSYSASEDPKFRSAAAAAAQLYQRHPYDDEFHFYNPKKDPNVAALNSAEFCKQTKSGGQIVREESVDLAKVLVDDREIGSLDPERMFTSFAAIPGAHAIKLEIKKDYPLCEKTLQTTAPAVTVDLRGGYRILYYHIDAVAEGGNISYALRLSQYDDILTFMREAHHSDEAERAERIQKLDRKLRKPYRRREAALLSVEKEQKIREERLAKAQFNADASARGKEQANIEVLAEDILAGKYDA